MALYDLDYSDGSTALRGYVACGDGAEKRPGIIVAPEAPGLTEHAKRRVRMLSDLGYVAMGDGSSKHGFTNSESDHAGMPMLGYNPTADRRSWAATQEFLAESLRP
jgi:dienelactone hydrolase